MHRLFAALPIPDLLAERLRPLRSDLHGTQWRRDDQYHVTLQFFGEVHRDIAEEIADQLDAVASSGFAITLSGVGWFGRRQPRALYARLAETPELTDLAAQCRAIARRLRLSFGQDPFVPHITLAYCHETPIDQVRSWSEDYQILRSEPFWVDRFHLYESFMGGHDRKSRYQVQASYPLGQI
ncbi:MAG: RNA 2',3'-cyclic phosphodiesterase [Pseudomonadota bacterium]